MFGNILLMRTASVAAVAVAQAKTGVTAVAIVV